LVLRLQWLASHKLEQLKASAKNIERYYWSVIKQLESLIERQI